MRAWWERRSERTRAWLRWGAPIVGATGLVLLSWWVLHTHAESVTRDRWLLRGAGLGFAASTVVLLVGTRRWTITSLGMVLTFAAEAALLARVFGRVGPRPTRLELDAIRALYLVGTPILIAGLVIWAIRTRAGMRDDPLPATKGET